MSKKLYVCRECGYTFPSELSHLIESNVQVYCERCGSPFILEGVVFKPAPTPYIRKKKPYQLISEKKSSNLEKLIQFLNKISFIPLFIFTFVSFGLIAEIAIIWNARILIERIIQGLAGLFLLVYDRAYISHKIKEKKYNEIFLDSFCWGILGCILFGLGVIILIKGVFIIIYVISDSKNKELKTYEYGLLAKDSINYLSAKAGFFILILAAYYAIVNRNFLFINGESIIFIDFLDNIEFPEIYLVFGILLIIAFIVLIIDNNIKIGIKEKNVFNIGDSIKFFILGIFGTAFFAAGIFILLKGILLFFLFLGKPKKGIQPVSAGQIPRYYAPIPPTPPTPPEPPRPILRKFEYPERVVPEEKETEIGPTEKQIEPATPISSEKVTTKKEEEKEEKVIVEELEEIPLKINKEEKAKREEDYELKLHESLLPVKDEKDKKLVKEYFSKIFALLSKDLRQQITELKVSKKEKRELLEELAFLTKEEQVKYIDAIISLYKEIPKKLINRIRKLPNVKPKHYDKIVEQLKYMNVEEQIKFVQFLEENA